MDKRIIENPHTKIANRKKEIMELQSNQKTTVKMVVVSPHISIISLNVNRLNSPIKRHRVVGWIKKTRPNYMLPSGDPSQLQREK